MTSSPAPDRRVSFRWPPVEVSTPAPRESASAGRATSSDPGVSNPRVEAHLTESVSVEGAHGLSRAVERLRARLNRVSVDRTAAARRVVLEASTELVRWLEERPVVWTGERAALDLELGLAPFLTAHGWRGCVALWIDCLRAAFRSAATMQAPPLRDLLIEECGLWVWSAEGAFDPADESRSAWNGQPFAHGRRLPSLAPQRDAALALLERDSCILVPSYSEGVLGALRSAREAGLDPEVVVGEGGADGSGKWLARELSQAGCRVRLYYDAVLADRLPWADRVWLGTESVGAMGFTARRGATRLIEAAQDEGVPVDVFSTGDDLVPGGDLTLPTWCEDETWLLWENPAQGVQLDSQLYEIVPADPRTAFLTECGHEDFAALHLRALRTSAQDPLSPAPSMSPGSPPRGVAAPIEHE